MSQTRTSRSRPLFSRLYARVSADMEERGVREHRHRLLEGLSGRVVEVGAGNGLNFAHYPAAVTEVLAVEPERHLRGMAEQAAAVAPVPVRVVEATAEAIPVDDGEFDAAVLSLVLCSVPDQAAALHEVHRVLRPRGELRYYEHVVSHRPAMARLQKALDLTVWPRIAGGCHAARATGDAIRRAGYRVEHEERFPFKSGAWQPAIPHILGAARRA